MLKKIIFITSILFIYAGLRAWRCVGCPGDYSYGYDEYSNRNFLPDMADRLETKHGIFSYIRIEKTKNAYDLNTAAYACLTSTAAENPGKDIIVIFINDFQKKGAIKISESLKKIFPEKYVAILQDDVLNNLQGKWYLRQVTLLTKILGSFVYVLEKDQMTKNEIERLKFRMIMVDDPVYGISLMPVIKDIIGLFYMEPLSFLFYYPFVMYFLMVRWFGMKFGQTGLLASNAVWAGAMLFTGILIVNRLNIYFPDYVNIFLILAGLNIPFYSIMFGLYSNKIETAASTYINEVTGGFDTASSFEGKRWGK